MNNFNKIFICEGAKFINVKDDKFKTTKICCNFFLPLDEKTVAANSLLAYLLVHSCKKYQDFLSMNKKLSELYGASLSVNVEKMGESQIITLSIEGIDDRYSLDNCSVSEQLTKLLCDVIFDPAFDENRMFNNNVLEQERRQLIEAIEADFNDKRIYAKQRCEELMCDGEKFAISAYGTKENVAKVTHKDIYVAWRRLIENSNVQIIMLGNSNPSLSYEVFRNYFSTINRNNIFSCSTNIIKDVDKVREFNDKIDVMQCKLVMGFRVGIAGMDDDVTAAKITTALFGGTPSSKLFLNVREKMSLCYYCLAKYNRYKGIVIVESGVEKDNIEKAKNEILNQLDLVKSGEITDFEIDSTKKLFCNTLGMMADKISSLESWYTGQFFDDTMITPEQYMDRIMEVTKEDIIRCANKFKLDTVYTLIGNGEKE